jgi:hypothetical protein
MGSGFDDVGELAVTALDCDAAVADATVRCVHMLVLSGAAALAWCWHLKRCLLCGAKQHAS